MPCFSVSSDLAHLNDGSAQLSLPWATGESWTLYSGLHSWVGNTSPTSSIDFTTSSGNVRAAGDGIVHRNDGSCGNSPGYVRIDHGNGWQTTYYHLQNMPTSLTEGSTIHRGDLLGQVGTNTPCGGTADGAHVHFTLWHFTGAFTFSSSQEASWVGVDIGGWNITWDGQFRHACMVKSGVTKCVGDQIYNDGAVGSGGGTYADGTFIGSIETGVVYRMAGGAPIGLYNWAALPGWSNANTTWIHQSAIDAMPTYPSDGTVISIYEAGGSGIYRFAGGAPLRLFNWGAISDCCGTVVTVNSASLTYLNHMRQTPSNGAVISIAEAGGSGIYRFVGGAPIRLFNWGAISDCCGHVVTVNSQTLTVLDHMNAFPANGSVISIAEAGGAGIYRFAGGAPLRLFNWGVISDISSVVTVNSQSLSTLDHMNALPADGAVISSAEAGGSGIYRFVGGAPIRLFNWGPIPGCCGVVVTVNAETIGDLDHMNAFPANGSFIKSYETGGIYRFAGSAPLLLTDPSVIPGSGTNVIVNQQSIDTHDHMLATPADGTIIEGLPSVAYWQITGGHRASTTTQTGSVAVNDATVNTFPT